MSDLDFKIKQTIFDDLIAFRDKLPADATGARKEGGMQNYDHPAGLALLGEDSGFVDTVIPLKMSGGCWDAPNINYKDMDIGFRALIKTGRRCVGMAFIRNPRWGQHYDLPAFEAKISLNLRSEIHKMRNSFEDIAKTLWIVFHKDNFRFYKPKYDKDKRMTISEVTYKNKIAEEEEVHPVIKAKALKAKAERVRRAAIKKEKIEKEKRYEEERKKKQEKEQERAIGLEKDFKEKKKSIIPIGNGLSYVLDGNGQYIILQTGT